MKIESKKYFKVLALIRIVVDNIVRKSIRALRNWIENTVQNKDHTTDFIAMEVHRKRLCTSQCHINPYLSRNVRSGHKKLLEALNRGTDRRLDAESFCRLL